MSDDDVQRWLHGLTGLLGVDHMFQEVLNYAVGCNPDESRIMRLIVESADPVNDRMDYGRYGSYFGEHLGDEIVGEVLMHVRALLDGSADGRPSADRQGSWDWAWRVERERLDVDRATVRTVLFTTFAMVLDDPPPALDPVIAGEETLIRLRDALHDGYGRADPGSPIARMARSLATRWATVVATYVPPRF